MAATKDHQSKYFQSHILPVYKRAMLWDDNLAVFIQSMWAPMSYTFDEAKDKRKQYIAGSCYEGASSPRMYRMPPVCEVDTLWLDDGVDGNYYGEAHPDKVGVYVIRGLSKQIAYNIVFGANGGIITPPSSANSSRFLQEGYKRFEERIKVNPEYYPPWIRQSYNIRSTVSGKGPSCKWNRNILDTAFQIDTVHGYHHHEWPKEAEEWKTRRRLWPPQSLVEKVIQQGHQVLQKLGDSADDMDSSVEFNMTFTLCERLLARHRTPVQRLVYLMAKTLFYTYLDLHDYDNPNIDFPSYALKTSMMWLMEQTPVEKWTEENIPKMLRELLSQLWVCVDSGILRNYFMIGANVLHNCTPALLEKVNVCLGCILSAMNKYLQGTKLYEANVLHYGYYVLQGGEQAYDDVVKKFQNDVLDALLNGLNQVHTVRSTYKRILDVLKQGTGEVLYSRHFHFDEDQCFHLLKTMMSLYSSDYMTTRKDVDELRTSVHINLDMDMWHADDLIKIVLCLDENLPQPQVLIIREQCEQVDGELQGMEPTYACGNRSVWDQPEMCDKLTQSVIYTFMTKPGETDIISVIQGQDVDTCTFSSLGDLVDKYIRNLHDNEAGRWWPQIYSLTRQIPELQMMDLARMLYLMLYSPQVQKSSK